MTQAGDPRAPSEQPQAGRALCPSSPWAQQQPQQDFTVLLCLRKPLQTQGLWSSSAGRASLPSSPAAVPIPTPMLAAPNPRSIDSSEFPNLDKLTHH